MSILSLPFYLFILIGLFIYYVIPKKAQWIVLLVMSALFYVIGGIKTIGFILVTTISVWLVTKKIEEMADACKAYAKENKGILSKDEIKAYKAKVQEQKKAVMLIALFINLGILAYMKYFDFIAKSISESLFAAGKVGSVYGGLGLVLPLGISFYTFTAVGYLLEVYGGTVKAEKNPFRLFLFLAFFPQMIQGPIARFGEMKNQYDAEHYFDLLEIEKGVVLVFWGLFKKLVIANRLAAVVDMVFDNPRDYGGATTILAVLAYSVWQYTDFSGGIDIVAGVAECFDIKLTQNFKRPYFSKNLAEFWRRWHISLGAWMRDFVFYPLSMSKFMIELGKKSKKIFGNETGKYIPVVVCDIVVFLLVGIWHGPYWHYVVWGLYNGLVIGFAYLLQPLFDKWIAFFHIKEESKGWEVFCILRTFLIVNIGWFFDRSEQVGNAFFMIGNMVTNFKASEAVGLLVGGFGLAKFDYLMLLPSIVVLFLISTLEEKEIRVRESIFKWNIVLRWLVLYALIFAVFYGFKAGGGSFAYAQF